VSEYEQPGRFDRQPTVEDIRHLVGPATPHFALQIRNRIANLITGLPADHPARIEGEKAIKELEELARGAEHRGPKQPHEHGLPSLRGKEEAAG
jgi:hypothetical protein